MSKDDEDERIYNDGLKEEELEKYKERARYWQEEYEKLRNGLPYVYHLGDFGKLVKQNDILKEKLIIERYWRLFSHLKDGMELAKEQLKSEMKDINWED